jgi:hypothetical protein
MKRKPSFPAGKDGTPAARNRNTRRSPGIFVEVQLATFLVEEHRFHAVGQDAFGHTAEIMEGVPHAVQQVMNVLPLRELHAAHARVAQRDGEVISRRPAQLPKWPQSIRLCSPGPVSKRTKARSRSSSTIKFNCE